MAQTGPPWDFSALDKILDAIMSCPHYEVAVGYPAEDDAEHEGHEGKKSGITNAELAAIHDLGAPGANIDARPFLRQSVLNRREQYTKLLARELRLAFAGNQSVEDAFGKLALAAEAGVKLELTNPSPAFAAISAETIERRPKKSTKPLIDTGNLRAAAVGVVREAGKTQ